MFRLSKNTYTVGLFAAWVNVFNTLFSLFGRPGNFSFQIAETIAFVFSFTASVVYDWVHASNFNGQEDSASGQTPPLRAFCGHMVFEEDGTPNKCFLGKCKHACKGCTARRDNKKRWPPTATAFYSILAPLLLRLQIKKTKSRGLRMRLNMDTYRFCLFTAWLNVVSTLYTLLFFGRSGSGNINAQIAINSVFVLFFTASVLVNECAARRQQ